MAFLSAMSDNGVGGDRDRERGDSLRATSAAIHKEMSAPGRGGPRAGERNRAAPNSDFQIR